VAGSVVVIRTFLEELPLTAHLARGLSQDGHEVHAWLSGGDETRAALATGAFARVVDLLAGFDRMSVGDDRAVLFRARELEERLGGPFVHRDLASDRTVAGMFLMEFPPMRLRYRWTWVQAVAAHLHVASVAEREFDQYRPVAILGEGGAVAGATIGRLGNSKSVAVLAPYRLTRPSGRLFFTDELTYEWDECVAAYEKYLDGLDIPVEVRQAAEDALGEMASPSQPSPSSSRGATLFASPWRRFGPRRLTDVLRDWTRASSREGLSMSRLPHPEQMRPDARLRRKRRMAKVLRDYESVAERSLPTGRWVSMFLHCSPESTVDFYAFDLQDQVAVARNVAAALPADMELLVKEHPLQRGHREAAFFRELLSIPGVRLLHHGVDTREVILRSEAVVTLNGTVAFEAMCLGVPSVVLAPVYYSRFAGISWARSWEELAGMVSDLSSFRLATGPERLAAVAARIACSWPGDWYPGEMPQDVRDRTLRTVRDVLDHAIGDQRGILRH
jgi:hypothetical protein